MNNIMNPFGREYWMKQAFREAERAYRNDEVPVGAVVVKDDRIIGRGYNQVEILRDPTAHAEMIALTAACENLECKNLSGCTLYVTLEPCIMCAGACVHARLDCIVYGAADSGAGACDSLYHIPEDPRLNHRVKIIGEIMQEKCSSLLQHFFREKRQRAK